jgi:hypothetical protein
MYTPHTANLTGRGAGGCFLEFYLEYSEMGHDNYLHIHNSGLLFLYDHFSEPSSTIKLYKYAKGLSEPLSVIILSSIIAAHLA